LWANPILKKRLFSEKMEKRRRIKMKRLITICLVAVVVLVLAESPASATLYGTVNATVGGGPGLTMASMIHPYDTSWYTGFTGQFELTYSNMTPPTLGLLPDAFCIEVQTISVGGTYPYSVRDAFDAPIPDGPADTNGGPMGIPKAEALEELWGRFHDQVNSNVTAAAFQLAVWEIIFEDLYVQTPPGWNVLSGKFEARDDTGDPHSAIVQANTWLGQINGQGPKVQLYGLTNGSAQDFLVPEPATACILGLGALSLLRRKR
jgi:hypothetical protein